MIISRPGFAPIDDGAMPDTGTPRRPGDPAPPTLTAEQLDAIRAAAIARSAAAANTQAPEIIPVVAPKPLVNAEPDVLQAPGVPHAIHDRTNQ